MLEIEAKMKLEKPEDAVAALQAAGAEPLGQYHELNMFFDTKDRSLLALDRGLRLRVSTDVNSGKSTCILTHKGPCRHGPLKSREETELVVEGCEPAERLLEQLGFQRVLSFEKRRNSWRLEGCRIELDEVPLLGHFIEIEGPSEAEVMRIRNTLGLGQRPLIKASYIAMLVSYFQERGQRPTAVAFPQQP